MYRQTASGWRKHLDFIILDTIEIQLALVLAFLTRMGFVNPYHNRAFVVSTIVTSVMGVAISVLMENHKDILRRRVHSESVHVFQLVLGVTFSLLSYLFFTKSSHVYSRLVVLYFSLYAFVMVLFSRQLRKLYLRRRQIPVEKKRHMLVVTNSTMVHQVLKKIHKNAFGQIEIIGLVLTDTGPSDGEIIEGVPVVCSIEEIIPSVQQLWVDEVLVCLPHEETVPEKVMKEFTIMGITTHVMLDTHTGDGCMKTIENVGGYTVLTQSIRMATSLELTMKRLMDIAGSLVLLLITGVIMIIVAPAIYFTDPGPIFFTQTRVGRNGMTFKLYNVFEEDFKTVLCNKVTNIAA